jgi:hypothetical protein
MFGSILPDGGHVTLCTHERYSDNLVKEYLVRSAKTGLFYTGKFDGRWVHGGHKIEWTLTDCEANRTWHK